MSENKHAKDVDSGEATIAKAMDFWTRNSKAILGIGTVLVLLVGGFYVYKHFFQGPKEEKAADAMFKAEDYYRQDSVKLALNGDGQYMGFLKIMDKYSGTDAANLACFYAGSSYLKLDDNQNAVKFLKKFSTDAKQIQQRAYKLLGDAYADLGNNKEALDYYKKAAHHFEKDQAASAEALFLAAYLADRVIKDQKEAIDLYKELKEKFPRTAEGAEADNYLAQLGVYNVN
ncbi:MAG TPA: tetratricopeptide repeat protein [Chitinophagaceae bacterium]|nr:tetratricopeptide repeat protein [Chitinophagaceae bacterium]